MKVISSYMGTLALQHFDEGAEVAEGESIGEVEAMKVFMRLEAPCAGKVHWLLELGEVVGDGDVVAEIIP